MCPFTSHVKQICNTTHIPVKMTKASPPVTSGLSHSLIARWVARLLWWVARLLWWVATLLWWIARLLWWIARLLWWDVSLFEDRPAVGWLLGVLSCKEDKRQLVL